MLDAILGGFEESSSRPGQSLGLASSVGRVLELSSARDVVETGPPARDAAGELVEQPPLPPRSCSASTKTAQRPRSQPPFRPSTTTPRQPSRKHTPAHASPPIATDGPCSCCSADPEARARVLAQAAQRPSSSSKTTSRPAVFAEDLDELQQQQAGPAAVGMPTVQAAAARPGPPLLDRAAQEDGPA